MATQTSSSSCANLVDPQEARGFIQRCIECCGSTPEHAACLADVLVSADVRGHYSHGLHRVEMYIRELQNELCDGMVDPVIVKETCATAYVDARNGIGMVRHSSCA
jgi:LDH2 family malate/lactate/ureidoglycolate dehydrogenase